MTAKGFGIGLSKTGTISLFAALALLGYRAAEHDVATDLPLAAFYPQLDERYPGSKFILTLRDMAREALLERRLGESGQANKRSDLTNSAASARRIG